VDHSTHAKNLFVKKKGRTAVRKIPAKKILSTFLCSFLQNSFSFLCFSVLSFMHALGVGFTLESRDTAEGGEEASGAEKKEEK